MGVGAALEHGFREVTGRRWVDFGAGCLRCGRLVGVL
jgi:hypothetical protein